jgi:hypothetical protein
VCNNIAKVITVANNRHQQRNLQTYKNSDHDHQRVHQQLKSLGVREGQKAQGRREPADHSQQQFDPRKAICKAAIDVARKGAADPHGKQVTTNDRGKLKNAITEKVARERSRDELINEPACSNPQHRNEKQNSQGLVNCGRINITKANRHCPEQDRERSVLLLDNFLPEVIGSYLVDDDKCPSKNHDADRRSV